jgi:hypothetical protein
MFGMKTIKRMLWGITALLPVFGASLAVSGQQSTIIMPINQATSYKGEEFLLIGTATRGAGEPIIAIDPKNPNILLVGAMSNLHQVEGQSLLPTKNGFDSNALIAYRNTPESSVSTYAISYDRGLTWRHFEDPFRDYDRENTTADTFVSAGPDGTLYIGAMSFFPQNASPLIKKNEVLPSPGHLLYGGSDIAWSSDEGKTWSTPMRVMGQSTPLEEYAPGVKPNLRGSTPYDRPYLIIDQSTGTLYVPGSGTGTDPAVHTETFLRTSDDGGKTWGLIHSYDSLDFPQTSFSSHPSAANGAVAVMYVASSVPASAGSGKCPCVVFAVSRDEGKTFDRHVVQFNMYDQKNFFQMAIPAVAADPSHPGRFAAMTFGASNTEIMVQVTDDYGKTWKGPVKAGSVLDTTIVKPDIGYSPKGELALMWLATKPDGTYTMWSNASHDGGFTFGKQVQVSQAASPARATIKFRGNNWDGDDLSTIAVDNDYVHIVWADGRAGFLGAWYARVPLSSY